MLSYSIGLSALRTAQESMDVVGQNLANATTPGYSRRLAQLAATEPLLQLGLSFGTGVNLADVRRMHDDLLEQRLREQHFSLGRLDGAGSLLQSLEGFFQEPSDSGLASKLDALWNGFSDLTNAASDTASRASLVQGADALAAHFRQTAAQIDSVGDSARQSVAAAADEVNGITSQLASVNQRVLQAKAYGPVPGDLQDEQDRLLLSLSDYMDGQVVHRGDGTVDVLTDGMLLVSGNRAHALEVLQPGDGSVTVRLADTKTAIDVKSGRLKGLLDVARDKAPGRRAELDQIARQLMLAVNHLHSTSVSGSGPYTSLTAAIAVGAKNGGPGALDQPLENLDLPFPVTNGTLTVNVTDSATGEITQHFLAIDPKKTTLNGLMAQLDGLPHLSASIDSVGKLHVNADAGFGFDFAARLDSNPDDAGSFGSGTATITSGAGPFALSAGDTLTISVDGGAAQTVTFQPNQFVDIGHATADEVAAAVNSQVAGLTASAQDGRLVLKSATAGSAGSLQIVASSNAAFTTTGVITGSDQSVQVALSGAPQNGLSGHFTVRALGDGTIGLTPGLQVEVTDSSGQSYGKFDVGSGYVPGDKLEILPGVSLTLSAGQVRQSGGDVFEFDLIQNSDSAGVLTGLELGALFTGTGAGDIAVASDVLADPRMLAGSRTGDPGDGSNFLELGALKDQAAAALGGRTIGQRYGDLVADVGLDVQTNQTASDSQQLLLTSLQTRQQEISGVNQDEEMLNLVQYQHVYQAAGKYLQTITQTQQDLMTLL